VNDVEAKPLGANRRLLGHESFQLLFKGRLQKNLNRDRTFERIFIYLMASLLREPFGLNQARLAASLRLEC
jgi:hypothetical protein